jgi:hypothetical protein
MSLKRGWALAIVTVGTIGILAHIIQDAFIEFPDAPLRSVSIFKYFTIQSNLIAIIYFWLYFSLQLHYKNRIFQRLIGMVVVCITITFLVFLFFLEPTYDPVGLDLLGSILLHYINPVLVVGFVLYYRKDYDVQYDDIILWLSYPLLYILFLVILGVITNDYLYPFFQVSEVGVIGFLAAFGGIVVLYLLLSSIFVKIVSRK